MFLNNIDQKQHSKINHAIAAFKRRREITAMHLYIYIKDGTATYAKLKKKDREFFGMLISSHKKIALRRWKELKHFNIWK